MDLFTILHRFGRGLPVTCLDFSARQVHRQVHLQWKTALEQNIKSFRIERSTDGIRYATIGETAAAGNSQSVLTYAFIDPKPLQGKGYYRLRQLDLDGQFSFSRVVDLAPNAGTSALIGPGPADGPLTLYVPASGQGIYESSLRNLQGREMLCTTALRRTLCTGIASSYVPAPARGERSDPAAAMDPKAIIVD